MDPTTFEEITEDLRDRFRPEIVQAKRQLRRLNGRIAGFIQEHPAACLVGAVALGYLVARIARRQG